MSDCVDKVMRMIENAYVVIPIVRIRARVHKTSRARAANPDRKKPQRTNRTLVSPCAG